MVRNAVCLPRPKSANAPVGAESIGGFIAAPSKFLTITKALQLWSSGGGVKGARTPAPNTITEADAARRRFVELFGDLPVHHINKGMAASIGTQSAEYPKVFPQT